MHDVQSASFGGVICNQPIAESRHRSWCLNATRHVEKEFTKAARKKEEHRLGVF